MIERKEILNRVRDAVLKPFTYLHKIHTNFVEAAKSDGGSSKEVIFGEGVALAVFLLGPTLVATGILTRNPLFVAWGSIATLAVPASIIAATIDSPEDAKDFIQVARGSSSTVK